MPATFVLSFDCEGKWGVADLLATRHARQLSDERLTEGYRAIVALLDEHDVAATFAFVGAFAQSRQAFARIRPALGEMANEYPNYLGPALRDIERSADGWHGDHLVDLVGKSRAVHEIALHGVTHVPWTELDEQGVAKEMALFEQLEGNVRNSRTFVYPRNLVAHSEALAAQGFAGFRAARRHSSRVSSLLSEFDLRAEPERPDARGDGIVTIPAGYFLNWRHGVRRLVPQAVTMMRAKRLLNAAAANGGIVYYWLHPENIVSAPGTLPVLRSLIREVAQAREAGRCEVRTQIDLCRGVQSAGCS